MSNVTRKIAEDRRRLAADLMGKGWTVEQTQKGLKETFGFRMNIAKIYKIKNSLKEVK